MQKIASKYTETLIAPWNAFVGFPAGECETIDGVRCTCKAVCTWNNADGGFDEEIDYLCQKYYGCSFQAIKSIWIGRLGRVSNVWHMVKLNKK